MSALLDPITDDENNDFNLLKIAACVRCQPEVTRM